MRPARIRTRELRVVRHVLAEDADDYQGPAHPPAPPLPDLPPRGPRQCPGCRAFELLTLGVGSVRLTEEPGRTVEDFEAQERTFDE